jgi:antitoxin component HigA of HigAB toxin-antitoxin module
LTTGKNIAELDLRGVARFSWKNEPEFSIYGSASSTKVDMAVSATVLLKTESDLDRAIQEIDDILACGRELTPAEKNRLDLLSEAVIEYEKIHHEIPVPSRGQMLRHLLDARGVSKSALAIQTGIPLSDLRMALLDKGSLSPSQLRGLARFFGVKRSLLESTPSVTITASAASAAFQVFTFPVKTGLIVVGHSVAPLQPQAQRSARGVQPQVASSR